MNCSHNTLKEGIVTYEKGQRKVVWWECEVCSEIFPDNKVKKIGNYSEQVKIYAIQD